MYRIATALAGTFLVGLLAAPVLSEEAPTTTSSPPQAVQTQPTPMKTVGGYFSVGGFLGDLDRFNHSVEQRGYTGVKDYAYTLGFGNYAIYKHLLLGLEVKGTAWRPTEGKNSVTELYGVNGLVNIGFNVLPTTRYLLYPYVSAGTGRLFMRLRQDRTTFDSSLAVVPHDESYNQRTGMIQAGLGFDANIPRRWGGGGRFHTIGVRVGYAYDPGETAGWQLHDVHVKGGPHVSMTGPYAQIILGKSALKPLWPGKGRKDCKKACKKDGEV